MQRPSIPAALLRTPEIRDEPPARPATQPLTLVLAAPDDKVAQLLRKVVRVWAVAPVPYDITVKVIVDANVQPTHQKSLELITVLAELGGDLSDCEASIPNIKLGFDR